MSEVAAVDKPFAGIRTDAAKIHEFWPKSDWPDALEAVSIFDPAIWVTRFPDHAAQKKPLLDVINARNTRDEEVIRYAPNSGIGSAKLMGLDSWGDPATDRLTARALALAGVALKRPDLAVRNAWATVYTNGDWALPHCHPGVLASVLYMLDPGDGQGRMNGTFRFVDPRVKGCCPDRMGVMSRPGAPEMLPGSMMVFPGQTVHMVTPYLGRRPRVTVSWDLVERPGAHPGKATVNLPG